MATYKVMSVRRDYSGLSADVDAVEDRAATQLMNQMAVEGWEVVDVLRDGWHLVITFRKQ